MNKGLAALQDESWAAVHGINENFEAFVKAEVLAEDPGTYTDNRGDTYEVFEPGESRSDSEAGLRDIFDASSKDEAVNQCLQNIRIAIDQEQGDQDFQQGQADGQAQANEDSSFIGNIGMLVDGVTSTPRYLFETITSDEVGPLDDNKMSLYSDNLELYQGNPYEVAFDNGYSDTIEAEVGSLGFAAGIAGGMVVKAASPAIKARLNGLGEADVDLDSSTRVAIEAQIEAARVADVPNVDVPDKPGTIDDFIDFNQGRSSDPGIPELVNAIEAKFLGSVKQLEINIFKPNNGTSGLTGERFTDLDILTDKAVIQVKIGKGKGIAEQLRVSEEVIGLKGVGFDANKLVNNPGRDGFRTGTVKDAQNKGFTVTNDVDELLKILEEL